MNDSPQTIRVNLAERSYDIAIGAGNLADAGRFLADRAKVTHVVLITDDNVHKPHAMQVAESIGEQDIDVDVIVRRAGRREQVARSGRRASGRACSIWTPIARPSSRPSAAAWSAIWPDSSPPRSPAGCAFSKCPRRCLAQVDSSVGGKVGINLPEAKNMVGAFHQPLGVLIDTATLATLPPGEFRAGLGEVVKYGVILDAELFALSRNQRRRVARTRQDVLAHVIARCCRLKADVVEQDEREESGLRAVLNFGHTFGHAFETLSGYGTLLHGEAVAIGMVCAAGWPSASAASMPRSPSGFARCWRRSACRSKFPSSIRSKSSIP